MSNPPVWKTHLAADAAFDPQYHQNPRVEVVSFVNEPPGVVLDVGCGGGATGRLIKEKFPGTRVLASVPNIRNLATLDDLAAGNWEYDRWGVLDITHLRFFTRSTLRRLFEETDYEVAHMEPLTQPAWIDRRVIARRPGRLV